MSLTTYLWGCGNMYDFKAFRFWCQKVIPLVYDDSLSYYEVLCKTIDYLNKLIAAVNDLSGQVDINTGDISILKQEVEFLTNEINKVKNGDYVSLYLDSIINWIDANIQQLVARIVKYVFFGLSNDGHFIANIPTSWQFIKFDTVIDPSNPMYGHLILRW